MKKVIQKIINLKFFGFPSFTAFLFGNEIIIEINKKASKKVKSRHYNHSEYLLIKNHKNKIMSQDEILIIQTFPPCNDCLNELKLLNKKIKIIYLFDPYKKIVKKTWKESKKITFEQIDKNYEQAINYHFKKIKKRFYTKGHWRSRKQIIKLNGGSFKNIKPK